MGTVDTKERRDQETVGHPGRYLRLAAGAVAVAALVLAVVLASRFGTEPGLVASPLIGQPAPEAELPRLNGDGILALGDLRGEVVVVNFWATWCVPCRAEHASLVATNDAFQDLGVTFIGVVYQDSPEAAVRFLDELGWGTNYEYVTDAGSRTAIAFGLFGIPETYFIDRDGVIVGKISGEADAMILGTTLDQILAGERPGEQTVGTVQTGPGG